MMSRVHSEHGFTLAESMIAMTILMIGMLGLVAMQTFALSKNGDAYQMTTASNLTSDLLERIVFNRAHVTAYHGIDTNNAATQPPTSEAMARGDFAQWQTLLNASHLTNARGTVSVVLLDTDPAVSASSLGRRQVTVQLTWTGPLQNGVTRPHTLTMTTLLATE